MRFLILGRSVGLEKKNLKKHLNKMMSILGIGGLVPQHQLWSQENNKTWIQNQYGGKVSGYCCKIKTAWEKGSTTETPMRHKNGLKTSLPNFFCLENARNLGRSDDAKRRKNGDGLMASRSAIETWPGV